jgi:malate dehydrogenase (oxaloacetate-decarboxylating)
MKSFSFRIDPLTKEEYWEVNLFGQQILQEPILNKGAAFSYEERITLGLEGLLRDSISDINGQLVRAYDSYLRKPNDIEKYIYLQGLLNRNEVLFYGLLNEHLKDMLPIVYTPTVGQACLEMSHITRRYRGIYISPENIHLIDSILHNLPLPMVYLIVVTDGERILGLGDLGSDGMGIPIGKINLYVAGGGLHPACCLPITLDVGTNNPRLLHDPLYLGLRRPRLEGDEYYEFVERFVVGIKRNFPDALIQWEDFGKLKSFEIFQKYHKRTLSFNDDIQGTGAVTLGALISAMRIKNSTFKENNFIIVGMGQAGSGIAYNIVNMLMDEGLSLQEAKSHIFPLDKDGLIVDDMPDLEIQMKMFAQKRDAISSWKVDNPGRISLIETIQNSKAQALMGVTAIPGLFSEEILLKMSENTEQPIIFALSNPTSKCECTPQEVYKTSRGKGIVATGSPFELINGEFGEMRVSQCNNMYLFPGIGLGALVSKTPIITKKMFLAGSKALSNMVTPEQLKFGELLPDLDDIKEVSVQVAKAVCISAREDGYGRIASDDELEELIRRAQWKPHYAKFRPGIKG